MFRKIGPGVLVAAAFIGPGTVTTCTLAGVTFGYALLWAMLLSIIATIVMQEMAARLGIVSRMGLADAIQKEIQSPFIRRLTIVIILGAIVLGNAAYEAGNIGGAVLGMEAIFGTAARSYYPFIIGIMAFVLLYLGSYKILEKVLVSLVILMSLSFLVTAIVTKPDLIAIIKGLFVPSVPTDSIFTVVALLGTTVVPYNLFLHASLVQEKWKSIAGLNDARRDTFLAIVLGGLVSMAVIVVATNIPNKDISNALDMAKGLEPLYGNMAKYFMGIGLFAAGITSAITAPLAAAYVANSCFGWHASLRDIRFRIVWIFILVIGVFSLSFDIRPVEVIKFAQFANGILLPVIAVFLLWVVNRKNVMGIYKNSIFQNVLATIIIVLVIGLGMKSILKVFEVI